MGSEDSCVALGLKTWNTQTDRADKLWRPFVRRDSAGDSAWQEQASLLVGTSHSRTRRDAAPIVTGRTTSS
jgi:hypothetical protein